MVVKRRVLEFALPLNCTQYLDERIFRVKREIHVQHSNRLSLIYIFEFTIKYRRAKAFFPLFSFTAGTSIHYRTRSDHSARSTIGWGVLTLKIHQNRLLGLPQNLKVLFYIVLQSVINIAALIKDMRFGSRCNVNTDPVPRPNRRQNSTVGISWYYRRFICL